MSVQNRWKHFLRMRQPASPPQQDGDGDQRHDVDDRRWTRSAMKAVKSESQTAAQNDIDADETAAVAARKVDRVDFGDFREDDEDGDARTKPLPCTKRSFIRSVASSPSSPSSKSLLSASVKPTFQVALSSSSAPSETFCC